MQRSVDRPAGPAILDDAVLQGAEVAADGDVLSPDLKVDAERLQDAAADAVFERVVAEQAQVPGPAARRDARQDRQAQPADALAGTGVQVGGAGRFQLGLAAGLQRQPAQAVGDQQDDLGVVGLAEFGDQVVDVHAREFTPARNVT